MAALIVFVTALLVCAGLASYALLDILDALPRQPRSATRRHQPWSQSLVVGALGIISLWVVLRVV